MESARDGAANHRPAMGPATRERALHQAATKRQAKVDEADLPATARPTNQQVGGLHVAVEYPGLVRRVERLGGQTGDRQKIVRSKRTGLLNVIIERGAAVEVLQLEKRPLLMDWIGEIAIQQSNDRRVTQALEDPGFAKNVGDVAVDSLVLEGLDHDLSPGVTVPAQKRDPEASCSQDAQNLLPMDGKGSVPRIQRDRLLKLGERLIPLSQLQGGPVRGMVGLGPCPGVDKPLRRLAGVGERLGEIAGHDLQPADVEPELRKLPPLIVTQGPIPPLHFPDQPPLVVVAVRDTVPDGQLPVQEPELVRQSQHVGMDVEHRVARLAGHAFDTSQSVQGFLQGLRLPLLDENQGGEPVLEAPVEHAQAGPGQLPGKDLIGTDGATEIILHRDHQQGLTARGREREQPTQVSIAQPLQLGGDLCHRLAFAGEQSVRIIKPAEGADVLGQRGGAQGTHRRQMLVVERRAQFLQAARQETRVVTGHSALEERLNLLAQGFVLGRGQQPVPQPLPPKRDLQCFPGPLVGLGQGSGQSLAVVGEMVLRQQKQIFGQVSRQLPESQRAELPEDEHGWVSTMLRCGLPPSPDTGIAVVPYSIGATGTRELQGHSLPEEFHCKRVTALGTTYPPTQKSL